MIASIRTINRPPRWRNRLVAGLPAIVLLGCSAAGGAAPAAPPGADGMAPTVQAALDDAIRRTGKPAAALKVVSAERVTWRDGSLGCPEPGLMYSQALVPGFRIRVDAGADALDYHADKRGELRLCPAGRATNAIAPPLRLRGVPSPERSKP